MQNDLYIIETGGLPASVDLRQFSTSTKNQGGTAACGGAALASLLEIWEARNGTPVELSAAYLYWNARARENNTAADVGVISIDKLILGAVYDGCCTDALWSGFGSVLGGPSAACVTNGAGKKVGDYKAIILRRTTTAPTVKAALASGYPVLLDLPVRARWGNIRGALSTHAQYFGDWAQQTVLYDHYMCIVGYDDALGAFIVKNSFGANWGDNGYFALPYDILRDFAMAAYVVTSYAGYSVTPGWSPTVAVSQADVNAWVASNPTASHARILNTANASGVTSQQLAIAYGIPVAEVSRLALAAYAAAGVSPGAHIPE